MSITHHPDDSLLLAWSAGTLDAGQHVAVATHMMACPACRNAARAFECIGGSLLDDMPVAPMRKDAFAALTARLNDEPQIAVVRQPETRVGERIAGLPRFVRGYQFGDWKRVAPNVRMRPIQLPRPSDTRVFLLASDAGTRMIEHTHSGVEMTCVLSGAFRHEGGRYGPGDFDLGDDGVDHRPMVESDAPCICLVAMQGQLRFKGVIGRMMQPFVRL